MRTCNGRLVNDVATQTDTTDEDDAVVTTKWSEASDVVDEKLGNFSQFRISDELQTKLRGLY